MVSFWGRTNRREEEGKEKKKKWKKEEEEAKFKVWILAFLYGNYEFCMGLCIIGPYMVRISMVFKPRVLLGFHPNPRFLESKVGKTLNGTRKIWNPPFKGEFMV